MAGTVALYLLFIGTPVLIIYLVGKVPFLNKLGAVVIAYILGLILGNIGILPDNASEHQNLLITLTIPLALPLLLFSLNIHRWVHLAGKTLLSMFLAFGALIAMVVTGHLLWGEHIQESWKVAGMLIGVYSGGTPNLASIKAALGVDETIYILTHTYDIVLCAVYLVILLTFGKGLLRKFLPRFRFATESETLSVEQVVVDDYKDFFTRKTIGPLSGAFGAAVLIFGIGGGLSMIVPEEYSMVTAILSITTLGILASLIHRINRVKKTFELGMYFILVFSLVVASMADLRNFDISSLYLFWYVALAVFGTLVLHILLARIFKIDADTTIITSVAMVFSPPFVPMMAGALKNRQIVLSGLAVGIIGYAVGNYLGVLLAYLIR
ncbi:MAG: DUF819 family protein [Bacteroidales bacterium]